MKKCLAIMVLLAVAVGIIVAAPFAGSAVNCRNAGPQPTPQSGSMQMPDGLGGTVWYHPSGSQVGIKGQHGYIVVSNTASGVQVYGYSADAGGLNGDVSVSQNNPSRVCIDTNGT